MNERAYRVGGPGHGRGFSTRFGEECFWTNAHYTWGGGRTLDWGSGEHRYLFRQLLLPESGKAVGVWQWDGLTDEEGEQLWRERFGVYEDDQI